MTINYDLLRSEVERAREHGHGVDPAFALKLLDALEAAEPELLLLRDIVSDLDEFFDSEEGPIMQPDHSCRPQRRLAQFYREIYKPSAAARGHKQAQRTWGRGRG